MRAEKTEKKVRAWRQPNRVNDPKEKGFVMLLFQPPCNVNFSSLRKRPRFESVGLGTYYVPRETFRSFCVYQSPRKGGGKNSRPLHLFKNPLCQDRRVDITPRSFRIKSDHSNLKRSRFFYLEFLPPPSQDSHYSSHSKGR